MTKWSLILVVCFLTGCATFLTPQNGYKWDPYAWGYHYNKYVVSIVSDPPGAMIELDGKAIGNTPLKRVFNGFQTRNWKTTIKAIPLETSQYTQVKRISGDYPIPRNIYFNMHLNPLTGQLNKNVDKSLRLKY